MFITNKKDYLQQQECYYISRIMAESLVIKGK